MTAADQSGVAVVRDPLAHFVEESLRAGVDREEVRRTLDRRIVTVIGEKTTSGAPLAEVQDVLDKYVRTVRLLHATRIVEDSESVEGES